MKILAIETSCDETAITILEATGGEGDATFRIRGNALLSQIDIHKEYGGVFPALAKRAHAINLTPLLTAALKDADMLNEGSVSLSPDAATFLAREYELAEELKAFLSAHATPDIDVIAVTYGPGLEPALWVGVNFAQALARAWNKPLVPVDHMEGHLLASLVEGDLKEFTLRGVDLPVLSLLVSGGHTELIQMPSWLSYTLLGSTRDDAVGEAFDKVARILGLPYPGGPEVSKLAERMRGTPSTVTLPRPMITSDDLDFSYSGLKTAVLYMVKGRELSEDEKATIAREFEDAAIDVLWAKSSRALQESGAKTLAVGGGVSANTHLRRFFAEKIAHEYPEVTLRFPPTGFTGDNAIMIGVAGYFRALRKEFAEPGTVRASGTLALHQ
ncbi:tRNA (adenosine(37)-N6)-threonylcarbamoyltransferase complex transferase subunit TsaD [Patescibacteria group bacterium]|nr:tRNA (adenosine(37)-N6)-threonylcarbamoyltransferase complex transferase subunit TsaD [Patescibacteria group bacterium]